jgi:hypothetical protein
MIASGVCGITWAAATWQTHHDNQSMSDVRVFQEIMTADDGPIARQVVCPRSWMLPENDWLFDGYEDQAPMPVR